MSDFLNNVPAPVWIVINTILGTLVLKWIEKFLNKNVDRREASRDYRAEISELQTRLDKMEDDIEEWRTKAHSLQEDVARLRKFIIEQGHEPPTPNNPSKPVTP